MLSPQLWQILRLLASGTARPLAVPRPGDGRAGQRRHTAGSLPSGRTTCRAQQAGDSRHHPARPAEDVGLLAVPAGEAAVFEHSLG